MSDTMDVNASGFYLNHTTSTSGDWKTLLKTENKFVDKDIAITITTPAASALSFEADDITSGLSMGSATNGIYSPVVTITGDASIATAGWITAGNHNISDTNVLVGTVNQSTISNGATTISSGDTIAPQATAQTITISEGYNGARTIIFDAADAGPEGEITSGSATINSLTYTHNSTYNNFAIYGSADVAQPTINSDGYISLAKGTKNTNVGGATVVTTVNQIGIAATITGTGTFKPSITTNGATNITAIGSVTTTQPVSGYYIAVASAANTGSISAAASVISNGYGTTTTGEYTTTSDSLTVGAQASSVTYIPLVLTTFANTAASGVSYTDISSTAPALISGSYLFINEGYTPNVKISLAKLVPDASGANASANYILNGYTAYNNDGELITGNILTYSGSYEVV